jgi:hypothetical protein
MKDQGFNFYVYLGPGNISYFYTREEAEDFAESNGAEVQEVY